MSDDHDEAMVTAPSLHREESAKEAQLVVSSGDTHESRPTNTHQNSASTTGQRQHDDGHQQPSNEEASFGAKRRHSQKQSYDATATAVEHEAPLLQHQNTVIVEYDASEDVTAGGAYAGKQHVVDRTHRLFLVVSIPMTIIVFILALSLYLSDNVAATHASHAVAGFCALCATVLTAFLIYCHLSAYTNPQQQRYICRILLMVPIYAIDSFIALMEYEYGNVVALVRDTYEAYVIYQFYYLLMDYLNGEDNVVSMWQQHQQTPEPVMEHLFPLSLCCKPIVLSHRTLSIWKTCLVQYMVLNPLLTMITLPLFFADVYHDGAFEIGDAYPYFAAIRFWSVTFAFTSLVYFFFATKDFMPQHNPMPKFAAIKIVVFLSFWQSILLAGLNHFHVIPHTDLWTSDEVATGLQNFIVCVEMYLVALAHRWVFSDEPYIPASGRWGLRKWAVLHVLSISDVIDATTDVIRNVSPLGASSPKLHEPPTPA